MQRNSSADQAAQSGADVTPTSPLPDVPDAGLDSQPLSPPEPVDISTAALNTHAALAAGTLNDADERTLYEQTLDAYEESAADEPLGVQTDFATTTPPAPRRRAKTYEQ
ncbi:MAG: hypothetical protein M3R24_29810 [Chloroflexota bacterium]|nr:hypothetical protein [Chloroflexota bacterium]PLS83497.1 MAG: hypothetical protein CYG59_01000 [Chloroflexota bacterium]